MSNLNDGHFHQAGKGCCPHPDCVTATSPSGSLSLVQQQNLREECRILADRVAKKDAEIALHRAKAEGEYWAWLGVPEEDRVESLTCPVLVPVRQVRRWLEITKRAEEFIEADGKTPPNKKAAIDALFRLVEAVHG